MIDNPIYTKAYTEVNCLLQYLPQSYLDKLPKKLMELIRDQSDTQYNIYIDTNKSLLEQNFSDKAIALIAVLKYNYWSTDEEKQQLEKIFYENENTYQEELLEKYNPDIVISIGQAGGRFDITPERVAINLDDARIADNEGKQPIDISIYEDGEPAYFSNLPIKAMVNEIKEGGLPASVSNTAGTFVCNHVMYHLLYLVDKKYPNMKAGFIHVPYIPAQVIDKPGKPSMSIADISKGLELAIKAAIENKNDINAVGGAIC